MKRDVLQQMILWKDDPHKKPLILRGARQAGKSWLVKEFGKSFENFVEINFEEKPELSKFFEGDLDPKEITTHLANFLDVKIVPQETLLFFDEIQLCPQAIVALRYFYEKMPGLHVIGAGSLLEFELENISIPVGRIQFLYLYPLSFGEFLTALGKDDLRTWLKHHSTQKGPEPVHQQLCSLLRDYVLIGGMPEVVKRFLETKDLKICQAVQSTLLETFREDFHKYAKKREIKFLQLVFESVPRQLGKKFKFTHVSSDIKSRELGAALHLLENAGLVHKVYHSSSNDVPLGGEVDEKKFKVLFFDVGLALRLLDLNVRDLYLNNDLHLVNDGAITELLAGLEIVAHSPSNMRAHLYYWHRESKSANAEVDYVLAQNRRIIPIEVKHRVGGQLKSLWHFMKEKNAYYGVRITQSPYEKQNEIETIPLYAIEGFLKREFK